MVLSAYTYVFVIGTFFSLLEAYNNGASKLLLPPPRPLAAAAALWRVSKQ